MQTAIMIVKSVNSDKSWEETIEVGTFETPEETATRIINNFNNSLRSFETERELVGIKEGSVIIVEETIVEEDEEDHEDWCIECGEYIDDCECND